MRATYSRWSWVGVTSCCLALTALTGCKSGFQAPSMDWLGWAKSKPSANSLASVPRKPSVGALPTPSATTAGPTSPYGQTGYARNTTGPGGYGATAQGGATGYQTGPYGTASAGGSQASSTGFANNPTAGATGPYRSPYQASQSATPDYNSGTSYGVADNRGSAGYQASPTAGGGDAQSWNADPYRRAGDPYGGSQTSASPYGAAQATGSGGQAYGNSPATSYPQAQNPYASGNYGTSTSNTYQQPAAYQQPSQSGAATATRAYASDSGQSAYPVASPSSYESSSAGGYRPGSTSRDTGVLSGASTGGGYPTTDGADTTANQSWSHGAAGQYPTTGQY